MRENPLHDAEQSCIGRSGCQNTEFNSSHVAHTRQERLKNEENHMPIKLVQSLAHFIGRRCLYLQFVSANFGLHDNAS